jgi:putative Mg2+ transporter-C (MgtC) family protein
MAVLDPLDAAFWATIGVALLSGGVVGLERQLRGKPAGVRTSILICLGTSIFVQVGAVYGGAQSDPTRVLGQVVTGVGFLGAGVILARGAVVTGVTTAAVIWVLAAIGTLIGFRQFAAAVAVAGITVTMLTGIELLESGARRLWGGAPAAPEPPVREE